MRATEHTEQCKSGPKHNRSRCLCPMKKFEGVAEAETFNARELELYRSASALVSHVPFRDGEGRYVRCHELTRAVGMVLGLQWCDGWYGMVDHSWLWTDEYEWPDPLPNILDVYAVGRLPMVQLFHTRPHVPFEYRRGDPRDDVRTDVVGELVATLERTKKALLL